MASQPLPLSPAAYLELERGAEQKHEFVEGEMVAMAGGSPAHALVVANVIAALGPALNGKPCFVFTSELRVGVHWDRLITYPDVTVVGGQPEHLDEKRTRLPTQRSWSKSSRPALRTWASARKHTNTGVCTH